MLKDRYKLWVLIIVLCLIAQFVVHTVGPGVVDGVKKWSNDYKQKQDQIVLEQENSLSEPSTKNEENLTIVNESITIILTLARCVGTMITIFGIFNLILALAQDNAEMQYRGMTSIVTGSILVGLSMLVPIIGDINATRSATNETTNTITNESIDVSTE